MTKRMLIDATHAEETRVAVIDGNKLVEFDYESQVRKQLKGSIFLAKVTRVEPSLQAGFVNFGGNRHGFLPFSEVHPDYYRIPVADREALIAEQQAEMEERRRAEEEADREEERNAGESGQAGQTDDEPEEEHEPEEVGGGDRPIAEEDDHEDLDAAPPVEPSYMAADAPAPVLYGDSGIDHSPAQPAPEGQDEQVEGDGGPAPAAYGDAATEQSMDDGGDSAMDLISGHDHSQETIFSGDETLESHSEEDDAGDGLPNGESAEQVSGTGDGESRSSGDRRPRGRGRGRGSFRSGGGNRARGGSRGGRHGHDDQHVESVGGEGVDGADHYRPSSRKHYKIQEVVKRGQIMLVQVSKEERGNKGAAVTTYLSLPGRYCVLMPNSPRGGGVSRKIASFQERRRMRELLAELEVPEGMSVIMRTAGVARSKPEIKRDLDYLLRLWDEIRETTLQSTAPSTIHEEGNLVRRSIRDIYTSEIEEVLVAGEDGYKFARDFIKMMIPSHVKRVKQYQEERIPLFHRYQIEGQIKEMSEPSVTLRSGGYLVINPTEALVSIDVNSGRATKERHIEETAVKTNLEAAEEVARQLRLRDLGGLVVIDFIDMEDRRNNRRVEERLKQALSTDRARIQVGRISSFGLMELSRQRLNPSLTEAQFEKCAHCHGTGVMRTTDSAAILALRALEEEGAKTQPAEIKLFVPGAVALYIFNHKRVMIDDIEQRHGFRITIEIDEHVDAIGYRLEAVRHSAEDDDGEDRPRSRPVRVRYDAPPENAAADDEPAPADPEEAGTEPDDADAAAEPAEGDDRPSRRRGRRGGRRRNRGEPAIDPAGEQPAYEMPRAGTQDGSGHAMADAALPANEDGNPAEATGEDGAAEARPRRRSRGGRNRTRRPREDRPQDGNDGTALTTDDTLVDASVEAELIQSASGAEDSFSTEAARANEVALIPAAPPSNDAEPAASRDYERINEPSAAKKKGWWNRLTE